MTEKTLKEKVVKICNFHMSHNQGVMLVSEFKKYMFELNTETVKKLKKFVMMANSQLEILKEIDEIFGVFESNKIDGGEK